MTSKIENLTYSYDTPFSWHINVRTPSGRLVESRMDQFCATCDSIKDKEIEQLRKENKKLKKLNDFYRQEIKTLELRTALDTPSVSLKTMVDELTSTPEGQAAWEEAGKERQAELQELVRQGKMSRVKYFRIINGIDQKTLADKLDMAQPNISRIERRGYNVPARTLKKLAGIFGVKVEDLIGD